MPFYRFFFTYYQMNKRVTVLDFYQKIRVYDYTLFQKFVRQLNTFISKNTDNLTHLLSESLVILDPVDNSRNSNFFAMLEALDFDAEMRLYSGNKYDKEAKVDPLGIVEDTYSPISLEK